MASSLETQSSLHCDLRMGLSPECSTQRNLRPLARRSLSVSKRLRKRRALQWLKLRQHGFLQMIVDLNLRVLIVAVSGAIIGLSSKKRIDEAVAAADITLTEEEKKYLEEPYQPRSIVGHS